MKYHCIIYQSHTFFEHIPSNLPIFKHCVPRQSSAPMRRTWRLFVAYRGHHGVNQTIYAHCIQPMPGLYSPLSRIDKICCNVSCYQRRLHEIWRLSHTGWLRSGSRNMWSKKNCGRPYRLSWLLLGIDVQRQTFTSDWKLKKHLLLSLIHLSYHRRQVIAGAAHSSYDVTQLCAVLCNIYRNTTNTSNRTNGRSVGDHPPMTNKNRLHWKVAAKRVAVTDVKTA